jgi:hypothetical protein
MTQHRHGSRKQQVHEIFRTNGLANTLEYGLSLGLAEGTIKSWIREWQNEPLEEWKNGELHVTCYCGHTLRLVGTRTCPHCGVTYAPEPKEHR